MSAAGSEVARHWDDVFTDKAEDDVSWYQADPATSLRLLAGTSGPLVDVGAGRSRLADALLEAGRDDITLVDVSERALEQVHDRLGDRVRLVVHDVTAWEPSRSFETWHDRAVFHFLTDPDDRARYVDLVARTVAPGGTVVLGTFGTHGPEKCSGLPTMRYSAEELAALFAPAFELDVSEVETHRTPWDTEQEFTWVRLRRRTD